MTVEFGLDTFGDITADADGRLLHPAQVLRDVVAEAVAAEEAGVDVFAVGEHHRPDFAISSPEVLLGAIAGRTRRIKLATAVTVLSSDDPVRVFQRFSTLDAVSSGRAEVILGRGSFTESFPLFGYALDDYETLFEEKLDLFAALRREQPVTWRGTTRPPLREQLVYPPTESGALSTWIGVGGSPQSVLRAVRYDMPMILAIIGGDPLRFRPFVDLYRRSFATAGKPPRAVGVHSHGHVAETDSAARESLWPSYKAMRDRIGGERGWPPMRRAEFEAEIEHGSLYVGAPDTVAKRIAATVGRLGLQRFTIKYSAGTLPHADMLRCIDLFGREVVPRVRALLADGAEAGGRARG
jgi:probable LLM family oxidoreductase